MLAFAGWQKREIRRGKCGVGEEREDPETPVGVMGGRVGTAQHRC